MSEHLSQSVCRHVVMFSGGIGSWATAKLVAEQHGTGDLVLLFADTKMEDEDTYRFIDASAANVGGALVRLEDGRDIWQVFRDVRFLGNTRIDPCSRILKRELMRRWVDEHCNPAVTTVYVGIDWTETHRARRYAAFWHPYAVDCPLTRTTLTKTEMLAWAASEGLPEQRLYKWGFHHANCGGGCVKAGQAQFELLLRRMPDRYAWWEKNEQQIRRELGKDITILRDRRIVHGREVVEPITLRAFRERLERQPSLFDADEWGACACTEPSDDELRAA
jgi:3'-phosphoadenosine 5'-phosphosulfate sulfotransferase (PAPS reductase)/FAD synthetase